MSNSTADLHTEANRLRAEGSAALDSGDLSRAISLLARANQLMPSNPSGYFLLANAQLKLGDWAAAAEALSQVVRLVPGDTRVQRMLGDVYVRMGSHAHAAPLFRKVLQQNPADLDTLVQLIEADCQTGNLSGAADSLIQSFVLTSNEPQLLRAYSNVTDRLGRSSASSGARHRLEVIVPPARVPAVAPVLSMVNIEITTFCNLRCTGCCRTVGVNNGTWQNDHMSLDTYRRIIDDLPPAGLLVPYGIGEPMLHPHIFDIIEIAAKSGKFHRILLNSNAMSRSVEDFDRLFDLGLGTLCFSVDSLDPSLIDALRPGTDVAKLTERVKYMAARHPGQFETRSVIGSLNIHALDHLVETLAGLGRFTANFQAYDDVGNAHGCMTPAEMAWTQQHLLELSQRTPNLRFTMQSFIPKSEICAGPWALPFITVGGDVTPCCRIVDPKVATFGNMLEKGFKTVWESAETNAWRESFKQESPAICKRCPAHSFRKKPGPRA